MTDHGNRRVIANITLTLDGRATGPRGENDMAFVLPHTMSGGTRDGIVRLTEATVSVGVAGLGLAGQDGSGRVAWRVTLGAIGPSRRCLPVELSTLGIAAGAVRPTSVT